MAVISLKNKTKSGSLLVGNSYYIPPSFESIATVTVGAGGSSSISFSSIPSTYKHLQIRGIARQSGGSSGYTGGLTITFNSDTGANYANHELYGTGSATGAYGAASQNNWNTLTGSAQFAAHIFDILDYTNTNKYKTIRELIGTDNNGSGIISLESALWQSTSAISTITLSLTNFAQYSQFALYGVKG